VRETPCCWASGHSEAMNFVKPESAARAGCCGSSVATATASVTSLLFKCLVADRYCISASFLYILGIYIMIDIDQIAGFDWDEGNNRKSADKHDVSQAEAESIFFNDPLIVVEDTKHSEDEARFHALGRTGQNRLLHITFTLRQSGTMIRVISARDMHRKERKIYEQA
jgi:uncharacterized DUF497 family protein